VNAYKKKNFIYLDTGRSALYLALNAIIEQSGKMKAWLPYYTCQSVIMPFKQLGFEVNYYSMGSNLNNPDLLPGRLDGAVFLFINYFGKQNYAITDWLDKVLPHDFGFIIEDNVPASLSTNTGQYGDFIINSYRKFLPQPDGALLASDFPLNFYPDKADETFVSAKALGKIIREYRGSLATYLSMLTEAENNLDKTAVKPRLMSYLSHFIFSRTDINKVAVTRRYNWTYLADLLKAQPKLKEKVFPLFDSLHEGEVPLGFPVIVDSKWRNQLRSYLKSQNIYCPVHWPIQASAPAAYRSDVILSNSILTLPIDQRLDKEALTYMMQKILQFFK